MRKHYDETLFVDAVRALMKENVELLSLSLEDYIDAYMRSRPGEDRRGGWLQTHSMASGAWQGFGRGTFNIIHVSFPNFLISRC